MSLLETINAIGVLASRPAAASANEGYAYHATDEGVTYRSNGSSWDDVAINADGHADIDHTGLPGVGGAGVTLAGFAPFASHPGLDNVGASATALDLATVSGGNGGAVWCWVFVGAPMKLHDYMIWGTDTSLARTAEIRLYKDNGDATADFVAGTDATFSFTPAAAARVASGAVSGAPVDLEVGWYGAVLRNTSTSRTFGIGRTSNATQQVWSMCTMSAAAVAGLGSSIDPTSWTTSGAIAGLRLRGRVLGGASPLA